MGGFVPSTTVAVCVGRCRTISLFASTLAIWIRLLWKWSTTDRRTRSSSLDHFSRCQVSDNFECYQLVWNDSLSTKQNGNWFYLLMINAFIWNYRLISERKRTLRLEWSKRTLLPTFFILSCCLWCEGCSLLILFMPCCQLKQGGRIVYIQ